MTAAGAVAPIRASEALRKKLAKIGLHSEADLLVHLPLRYEDETRVTPLASAPWGEPVQVEVIVGACEVQFRPRRQMVVRATDASGEITLRFFSFYPSQQAALSEGSRVRAFGEVRGGFFGAEMVHPRFHKVAEGEPLPTEMTPIYPSTAGVGNGTLQKLIGKALADGDLSDTLPDELRRQLKLPGLARSLRFLHRPPPGPEDQEGDSDHRTHQQVGDDCRRAHGLAGRLAHLVFVANPPQHAGGDFCLDGETVRYAGDAIGPTLTYAGTGVFSPTFFADVPDGTVMKLRPLLDAGITRGIVSGEHHAGRWVDVGTPERLTELERELQQTRRPPA